MIFWKQEKNSYAKVNSTDNDFELDLHLIVKNAQIPFHETSFTKFPPIDSRNTKQLSNLKEIVQFKLGKKVVNNKFVN